MLARGTITAECRCAPDRRVIPRALQQALQRLGFVSDQAAALRGRTVSHRYRQQSPLTRYRQIEHQPAGAGGSAAESPADHGQPAANNRTQPQPLQAGEQWRTGQASKQGRGNQQNQPINNMKGLAHDLYTENHVTAARLSTAWLRNGLPVVTATAGNGQTSSANC